MSDDDKFGDLDSTRRKGLETMEAVYGFDMSDGPGDFFAYTADHLFADIWNRPGLSIRDRRLLLIGLLAGRGCDGDRGIGPAQQTRGRTPPFAGLSSSLPVSRARV